MKLGHSFLMLMILPIFSFASVSRPPLMPVSLQQLEQLSAKSFRIQVDPVGNILLKGQWPKSCSEKAEVSDRRTNYGLAIKVLISTDCLRLLKLSRKKLSRLPKQSLSPLRVRRTLRPSENVYIESLSPIQSQLDLSIDDEIIARINNDSNSPFLQAPGNNASAHGHQQSQRANKHSNGPQNGLDGSIGYRRCNPKDYGTTDTSYCSSRHGVDLNADVAIGKSTKIVGTTMLDFVIPDQVQSEFSESLGVRIGIVHEISDSVGTR